MGDGSGRRRHERSEGLTAGDGRRSHLVTGRGQEVLVSIVPLCPTRLSRPDVPRSGSAIVGFTGCSNLWSLNGKIPRKISRIGLTCFNDINTFIRLVILARQ